jgi:hypothetical protein
MARISWHGWAAVALVGLSAGGCEMGRPAADAGVSFDPPKMSASGAKAAGYEEMPTPPPGAQYTIYCQAYTGPDHQVVATQVRDLLRANTSFQKWYVVHADDQSTLYYGFYRTLDTKDSDDAAEGQRAIGDLNAIRTLHDSRGNRLFPASLPEPISSPDPAANPAWDITRSGAYWSLEIANFRDRPDRKQAAVEAVAEARKAGIPAYYYHGPHASSVCIGAWPRSAASEVTTAVQNTDPDLTLFVTPNALAPSVAAGLDPNVRPVAPHVEPVDPSMIEAIRTYPSHAVNGSTRMKTDARGNPTDVPSERSFLFVRPTAGATDDGTATAATHSPAAADSAADVLIAPAAPAGSGLMRGLPD